MALTKAEIAGRYGKRRFKDLECGVRIRSLYASEMRDVRLWLLDKKGEYVSAHGNAMDVRLFSACVVNGTDDQPLFSFDEALKLDGGLVSHVGGECRAFTGFDKDADFKAIEDAAKNSDATSGS